MEPALAVIWLSIGLGAALGLGQRWAPWATNAIRTFAVLAAALVVALALLPHALMDEAFVGLLGGALGYAAIPGLERFAHWLTRGTSSPELRLEISYAGLLLHRLGDGVAMSAEGHGYAVLWAIGAHEIPIVALVTLAYARRGALVALARAAALGLASSFGLALVRALPVPTWHALHGWTDALAVGVLLHIVAHESSNQRSCAAPHSRAGLERLLDLGAAALALLLIGLPACARDPLVQTLLRRSFERLLELAPLAALGLGVLALVRARRLPSAWVDASGGSRIGILLALPHFEPPSLALFTALLGWRFTLHQVLLAGAAAGLTGLAVRWLASESHVEVRAAPDLAGTAPAVTANRWLGELEQLIVPTFGWLVVGVFTASLVERLVPGSDIMGHGRASWSWAALLASLASACMPAAAPVAAALVVGGLPPGLALGALLLGPAARLFAEAGSAAARDRRGSRTAAFVSLAVVAVVTLAGWEQLQASVLRIPRTLVPGTALGWFFLLVFVTMAGKSIWQFGVRGWLRASLTRGGALHAEPVPHAHGELAVHFVED